METLGDKKQQKTALKFYCNICDFGTSKRNNYDAHLLTAKHKMVTDDYKLATYLAENQQKSNTIINNNFICSCGKQYKHRQGLWRHNKTCSNDIKLVKDELSNKDKQQELIDYLMKENSEFKQLMISSLQEQSKTITELAKKAGNNNNNTTNNNNQHFNLHFYLNETCKNAMNIMDFVSQLQVGIKDLEETGRLGYAEGISKIFIDGLKKMNVNDRPIHCSDPKRETLYIKDNNEWNKETEKKVILTNAIKHVAHKNIKQISEWTKIHPDYKDSKSKENDKYLKIVSESMSGTSEEETNKNYSKIIRNIAKETIVDKTIE